MVTRLPFIPVISNEFLTDAYLEDKIIQHDLAEAYRLCEEQQIDPADVPGSFLGQLKG